MAIFKLGAIITGIVGSIGGTTFKRSGGNLVMSRKSFGGSRTKLLQNKQLNPIGLLFKKWSSVSEVLRTDWEAKALLFTFPDKFGVYRNITGRQLFTKLNIQLLPSGGYIEDPTGMSSGLVVITVFSVTVNTATQSVEVICDNSGAQITVNLSAEISLNTILNPTFTKRKVLKSVSGILILVIEMGPEFFSEFAQFTSNYNANFYLTVVNEFGFKSAPYWVKATVV